MTYKTVGDAVRDHAQQVAEGCGTDDGIRMLELDGPIDQGRINGAANLYLAALSIIRQLQREGGEVK